MQIDHSIAKTFKDHRQSVFRIYGWKPIAISYGYHQKTSEFNTERIKKDSLGFVKRPTGGRAIFHANELTYAIILPIDCLSKFDLYRKTHQAFAKIIKKFSEKVDLSKKQINFADFYKEKRSAICFAASARYEVGQDNKKMIGSAQRLYKDAILQHGSIMLGNEHLDLINYLNISDEEKDKMRIELEKKAAFFDLKSSGLTLNQLGEEFLDCLVDEIGFNSIKTSTFEDLNIELKSVE